MFVLENLIFALAKIIDMGLTLYMWLIIGRAVVSWVNPDPYNPIVNFLNRATEPVLAPVRRWIPMGDSASTSRRSLSSWPSISCSCSWSGR